MEKGVPGDSRFPERDSEWVGEQLRQKELLIQWLEGFKGDFGNFSEAQETISLCEQVLELHDLVVDRIRVPLSIQCSRNARKADGSCLEYGLDHTISTLNATLDKGIPNDPRFPERDREWVLQVEASGALLTEWLEEFNSEFSQYPEAESTIAECEQILLRQKQALHSIRIPLMIRTARNNRSVDGSCLEYGLEQHLEIMNHQLEAGPPTGGANEWIKQQNNRKDLLLQWLEAFKRDRKSVV